MSGHRRELSEIIGFMTVAEGSKSTGARKKAWVQMKLHDALGVETYERYEPVFSELIDLLKKVADDPKILKNIKSKYDLCCIGS
jgi:hypothetical protein